MTSKEYYGMYTGCEHGDDFLFANTEEGTEVFDRLTYGGSMWTSWQYDKFEAYSLHKFQEIVLPVEFLT